MSVSNTKYLTTDRQKEIELYQFHYYKRKIAGHMHHLSLYTHREQIIISSKYFILRRLVGIYLFYLLSYVIYPEYLLCFILNY